MKKNTHVLTIGKLAKKLEINLETIRFYQREGLLDEPVKSLSGYRHYNTEHVMKLTFIKKAKDLGFTLKEIRDLSELNTRSRATCGVVKKKALEKIDEIDRKIDDLKKIKASLRDLAKACADGNAEMKKYKVMDCFESNCEC